MINYLLLGGLAIGLGLLIGKGTHRLRVTGVVGYIIAGFILGPEVLGVLDLAAAEVETVTNFSLAFVAFVIGGELTLTLMRRQGRSILAIILGETLGAFFMVFVFVYLVTADLPKAIIFAAMAPASAPAGAVAIIQEYKARGKLTNSILAVVGLDDGLAIFIYAFSIAIAGGLLATGGFSAASMLVDPLIDTGGALLLGLAMGLGAAFVFRRLVEREEIIAVALTAILLTAGLATLLDVSLILASLAMGMTVTNVFPRVNRPVFDAVKVISLPVYVLFFVLAGLNLHLGVLAGAGVIGVVYVVCRSTGKLGGAYAAARATRAEPVIARNIGLGTLTQAGVAIGLALLASTELAARGYPDLGRLVLTTITATTVVFEIVGPLATWFALHRAGELGQQ